MDHSDCDIRQFLSKQVTYFLDMVTQAPTLKAEIKVNGVE